MAGILNQNYGPQAQRLPALSTEKWTTEEYIVEKVRAEMWC
jgi:hypothetical protein